MTTATAPAASRAQAEHPLAAGHMLVAEIERYLAARTRATAHPLVTKTTEELVAEALGHTAEHVVSPAPTPILSGPKALLRFLPDWALSMPPFRQFHGGGRQISTAEHLELTALVIERYGWAHGLLRTSSGRRCILGAQIVLVRLGYGDGRTARAAGLHLQAVLTARGIATPYHEWNDHPDRTATEALYLIRQAATAARGEH
ncbi:hypothetical protein ACFU99_23330 [Streptomyces sp. NPDC057654]|uniref:DUF6197 family protein n=1 Tax=Streptomyces sp. NPDC057654 TaxID=3346196 RepID=UPI0036B2C95B